MDRGRGRCIIRQNRCWGQPAEICIHLFSEYMSMQTCRTRHNASSLCTYLVPSMLFADPNYINSNSIRLHTIGFLKSMSEGLNTIGKLSSFRWRWTCHHNPYSPSSSNQARDQLASCTHRKKISRWPTLNQVLNILLFNIAIPLLLCLRDFVSISQLCSSSITQLTLRYHSSCQQQW